MARSRKKRLGKKLIALVRRLEEIKSAAEKLGIFVNDRELLSCPRCGVEEDIAIDGRLFVTARINRERDTGLRFARVSENGDRWRCPWCKLEFKEPEEPAAGRR